MNLIQKVRNPSIQNKLILVFIVTICVPLTLFGIFFFSKQMTFFQEEAARSMQRETIQMADRMNMELRHIESLSNLYYLDEDLNNYLLTSQSSNSYDTAILQKKLDKYKAGSSNIYFRLAIATPDGQLFGDSSVMLKQNHLPNDYLDWLEQLQRRPTPVSWTTNPQLDTIFSSPDYPYIYLTRIIHDRQTWQPTGVLIIGLSELELIKMYTGYLDWNQNLYILDANDRIISHMNNLSDSQLDFNDTTAFQGYAGNYILGNRNTKRLIAYSTIRTSQWKLVTESNLNYLLAPFASAKRIYIYIILVDIFASLLFSLFFSRKFLRPIKSLHDSMNLVKSGNLHAKVHVESNDEIGELSFQFNEMLNRIEELMSQVVIEENLKREAEIKALQSQINPHFLYNTLASVRYMVYTGNKEDSDAIILSLILLMKNALSDNSALITIEKEIELLKEYIHIQRLTIGKPLEVRWDIDSDILHCEIIKLILQPIVENAFLHGLKPSHRKCVLQISGHEVGGDIEFEVQDNGNGMGNPDILNSDFESRTGTGLKNVHSRIVFTFGNQYGLSVKSVLQEGTTVKIRIPKQSSKGGYTYYEHSNS